MVFCRQSDFPLISYSTHRGREELQTGVQRGSGPRTSGSVLPNQSEAPMYQRIVLLQRALVVAALFTIGVTTASAHRVFPDTLFIDRIGGTGQITV